jgi:3'(2'), 5'-bisphosphate nucleotidase
MIDLVQDAAKNAGKLVLDVFQKDIHIQQKSDGSPLTIADELSHTFLMQALPKILNVPVLSEECNISYDERRNWQLFWLIDPLDGTKEFINGQKDFCVNIALIQHQMPILGVIYAPALNEMYVAEKGRGFSAIGIAPPQRNDNKITVAESRFHHSQETQNFIKRCNLGPSITIGAALKFCRIALGEIDIYPRFQGSSEWDTAAGQIIVEEAGGKVIDLQTQQPPVYNKTSIRNNNFIAARSHIPLDTLIKGFL